jgi:tRNA (cmo5U34)-methyltransferase
MNEKTQDYPPSNRQNLQQKDSLYENLPGDIPFEFNEEVTRVFPDMINRSVPGYEDILKGIGLLTKSWVQPRTNCYDLGASLGAATLEMRRNILVPGVKIIAIDSSKPMVLRCREHIAQDTSRTVVEVCQQDLLRTPIENASVVVLNFTLQFVDPRNRPTLLRNIYQGLVPGGILILSEKIQFPDSWEQGFLTNVHHSFKRKNGYSDLEIARKRQALENVLIPWTKEEYQVALTNAGFHQTSQWYQFFQFVSFVAQKDFGIETEPVSTQ